MSRARNVRRAAQRAIGTPDASELAAILEGFQRSLDGLLARITQLETSVSNRDEEVRAQLDLLRKVATEHAASLDRLVSGNTPTTSS